MAADFDDLPIPSSTIPELTEITYSEVADSDLLLVHDASVSAEKKFTFLSLKNYLVGFFNSLFIRKIDNVSDLASYAPIIGQVYCLKEFESGSGRAGGSLVAKSGVITPDNKNTFASATSGVYFERLIPESVDTIEMKSAASFFGVDKNAYSAIVLLGDSNSEGAGTTSDTYADGFAGMFMRAVENSFDTGINTDRGFRYESILKMSKATGAGVTTNGSFVTGGVCDSRLSLADTQAITITAREIASADVFYDATLSTGSLEFRLNGTLYKTVTISGTGTKDTHPSFVYGNGWVTKPTDVITITSVGGTVVITELLAIRYSVNRPLCYSLVRQGWGLEDFSDSARVSEAAEHINRFAGSGVKLVIICLGTNNQNGLVGRELSPTEYITALDDLIEAYRTALTVSGSFTRFAVWVPHKTLDARPLGTYQEYIDAIVEYCDNSVDTQCIRLDKTAVGYNSAYLADDRHFNDIGHSIVARVMCDNFGVPQDFIRPVTVRTKQTPLTYSATLFGSSTAGSNTYSSQAASYYAKDELCVFNSIITLATKDAAMAGNVRARVSPLLAQAGNQPITVSSYAGLTMPAGYTQLGAVMLGNTNTVALLMLGSGVSPMEIGPAHISGTFSVSLCGSYFSQ